MNPEPTIENMIEEIIAAVPGDLVLDFTQGEWVCLYGMSPVGEGVGFIAGRHIAPTLRDALIAALNEIRGDQYLSQFMGEQP